MPLVAVPQFPAQLPAWTIAQLGEEDQVSYQCRNSTQLHSTPPNSSQLNSNQPTQLYSILFHSTPHNSTPHTSIPPQDLTILCLDGSVMASQARLAMLSPMLYSLLQGHVSSCSFFWLHFDIIPPPGVLWVRWPDLRPSLFHQPAGGGAPPGD